MLSMLAIRGASPLFAPDHHVVGIFPRNMGASRASLSYAQATRATLRASRAARSRYGSTPAASTPLVKEFKAAIAALAVESWLCPGSPGSAAGDFKLPYKRVLPW